MRSVPTKLNCFQKRCQAYAINHFWPAVLPDPIIVCRIEYIYKPLFRQELTAQSIKQYKQKIKA